ncbi:hypothetical protein EPN42_13120 [bacterium]|nr:MAG: hypothetical protein EPN42_13120 [bacterium]
MRVEPVYQSLVRPIVFFGIERGLLFIIATIGMVPFAAGLIIQNFLLMGFAVALTLGLGVAGAVVSARNPRFVDFLVESLGQARYLVPRAGLRGRDGV